jgi:hypothetical protein
MTGLYDDNDKPLDSITTKNFCVTLQVLMAVVMKIRSSGSFYSW